jgi:hypothetical protein
MKTTSEKPKGQRIFKTMKYSHPEFRKKIIRPLWIEPIGENWCFDLITGEWTNEWFDGPKTTSYYSMKYNGFNNIYSLKAAKRKIKKWNVPKGTKFSVSLPWNGYEFIVTKN